MPKSLVALVGRPNVGKSTLFNRLVGARTAIIEDMPGTTRDRLYGTCEWLGQEFGIVDMGGIWFQNQKNPWDQTHRENLQNFNDPIFEQVEIALAEADAIIFLADVKEGLSPADEQISRLLRRNQKRVLVAVNKAETEERVLAASEFWQLGLGEPHPISALHGDGVAELLDELMPMLRAQQVGSTANPGLEIAIVGRPNVGKSSLLNSFLQEERAITSAIPGTTRDPVDTEITFHGQKITLIDTAGIRRRGRVERGIEKYSVLRSARSIDRAQVCLLTIDAQDGLTAQDAHIAGMVEEKHKGVILLVNKWDAIERDEHTILEFEKMVRSELKFLPYAPLIFVSALTHQRIHRILPLALEVQAARTTRVSTARFNQVLQQAYFSGAPPSRNGQPLRLYYGTQVRVSPPTFVIFVNNSKLVHFSYERFIENSIRQVIPFPGTPISLEFRSRSRSGEDGHRN